MKKASIPCYGAANEGVTFERSAEQTSDGTNGINWANKTSHYLCI